MDNATKKFIDELRKKSGALNPATITERLTSGMPEFMKRIAICEWLAEEMKNRSSMEFSHYLVGMNYDYVNPGIVLTFKFPFDFNFMNSLVGKVELDSRDNIVEGDRPKPEMDKV